ncbi:MAG: UPF0179 family protein [Haloarculaceae archaeon]
MSTVTLVGDRLAEVDREFVYRGEAEGCAGCPYRDQCLNLTEGRRYRITEVREGGQVLDCAIHDTGVRAVEVEPAPVTANVADRNAYAGSKVALEGPCPYTGCPSHEYCEPAGADFDTDYRIAEVLGDPPHDYCALDRDLTLVSLEPPEDA